MTEPRTRLQAAGLLNLAELPDPLRWDHLLKLLPQYKAALTAAARSGELPTVTHTIEPKPLPKIERGPWFGRDGTLRKAPPQPRQAVRYTTVWQADVRAFFDRRREDSPAWLAEVPAAKPEPAPHSAATLGSRGGEAASGRWKEQRKIARRVAEQLATVPGLQMKDYVSAIFSELKKAGLKAPDDKTLRRWLHQWHKAGEIYLPPEVSKPGRSGQ
jgi:hypothetical protein